MDASSYSLQRTHRRFVLDVSDLWDFLGRNSGIAGIQRLLLSIAANRNAWPHDEVVLGHWNPLFERYVEFPAFEEADFDALRARLRVPRFPGPTPGKHAAAPLRRAAYYLRRSAEAAWGDHVLAPLVRRRLSRAMPELTLRKGDVFLSLGAGWNHEVAAALDHVAPLVARGDVELVSLVHDLIPLRGDINEHTPEKTERFTTWFRRITALTGRFLVYSRATEEDLRRMLERFDTTAPRIERFPLAHELAAVAGPDRDESALAENRVGDRPFVLAVGPVRGRKNGDRLAAAWCRLAERHGADTLPTLAFAGSGRRSELEVPIPAAVEDRIRFVRTPSDTELASLYRSALFCVFPSLHEGWGLPVGEALWHGRLCLTSFTSSLPEVAGPLADYFDPRDVDAICEALERPLFDREYLAERERRIRETPLRSWHESTRELFEAATRLVA